jgi:hypothetical protein
MQRFGTGLVYHLTTRRVICSKCGTPWEERFVGVGAAVGGDIKPICPRCLPAPLTVEALIEAEVAKALGAAGTHHDQVREATAARYQAFLAQAERHGVSQAEPR